MVLKEMRRSINNIVERHDDLMKTAQINPKVVGRSKIDEAEDAKFVITGFEKTAEDIVEANESINRKSIRKIKPKELDKWTDPWNEIDEDIKYVEENNKNNDY